MFATINPIDNQTVQSFDSLTETAIFEKLTLTQHIYYDYWRGLATTERAAFIKKIGERLLANLENYAALITLEMGKPITQSRAEIEKCAWLCDYFAANAATFLNDKIIQTDYHKSYVHYEPLGAVFGIMPWNFPFWQAFRFAIPALCAGNVILLKPAPNVPQCGLAMAQLFDEVVGKAGIFQTLLVEVEQVESIIAHPIVRGVALTGSDRAGATVAALAGKHLKRCVMELGGSDPFIVLDDADIAEAAKFGMLSRMNNAGQTCIAAKRFIVHESIAEAFLQQLEANLEQLNIGDPSLESTNLGTLARPDLHEQLARQVQDSVNQGATVRYESDSVNADGNFFKPMILANVLPGMPAYEQELFGPVVTLFTVANDAEAIRLANDSIYGLGASIWSQNPERAQSIAKQLEVGFVAINDFVKSDPRLPFGGMKRSGFGRELAEEGIKEFVNVKTIVIK
ncbi:MAG: NAD-dependent succinate-semialdehyde dehydrogenase [Saprospiraceae bacterium]